jgi:hypothetical protein
MTHLPPNLFIQIPKNKYDEVQIYRTNEIISNESPNSDDTELTPFTNFFSQSFFDYDNKKQFERCLMNYKMMVKYDTKKNLALSKK